MVVSNNDIMYRLMFHHSRNMDPKRKAFSLSAIYFTMLEVPFVLIQWNLRFSPKFITYAEMWIKWSQVTAASPMWLLLVQETFLDMNLIFLRIDFFCCEFHGTFCLTNAHFVFSNDAKHMEFYYSSFSFCTFPDKFWQPVTDFWA